MSKSSARHFAKRDRELLFTVNEQRQVCRQAAAHHQAPMAASVKGAPQPRCSAEAPSRPQVYSCYNTSCLTSMRER
jgi:hypothetical protein